MKKNGIIGTLQIKKSAAIAKVSKADYNAEVMRKMMADRATPHTVTA